MDIVDELESVESLRATRRQQVSNYPSLTVVLSTARPKDLSEILIQIEQQTLPIFSLALGIHGFELESGHNQLIENLEKRSITVTTEKFASELTLGQVLTSLAEKTKTDYVAKMDDDDIYGPHHLQDLLDTIISKKASVVGRAMNYIYLEGLDLTVRRFQKLGISAVELWTDWVCGGTILVESEIARKSGWFGEGKSAVDRFLLTGVKNNGGKIWRTYGAGYIYRRSVGNHTYATDYAKYLKSSSGQHVGIWKNEIFGTR